MPYNTDYNLIFVNTTPNEDKNELSSNTFQFETISKILKFNGNISFRTAPEKSFQAKSKKSFIKKISKSILSSLDDRLNVVCFTNYGSNLQRTLEVAKEIRQFDRKYNLILLAGGPGIVREKIKTKNGYFPDSIDVALRKTTADGRLIYNGAIQGGFGALIKLLNQIKSKKFPSYTIPKGFYFLDQKTNEVIGNGKSKFPKFNVAPYVLKQLIKNVYEMETIFRSDCNNGCDFCSRGSFLYSDKKMLKKAIESIDTEIHKDLMILKLNDPNPLLPLNIETTYSLTDFVESQLGHITYKSAMIDSGLLRTPSELLEHIDKLHIHNMFIGMDAISDYEAGVMGAKYNKRVKTNDDIQSESEGLQELIKKIGEKKAPYQMLLSYIHLPNETGQKERETIFKLNEISPKNLKLVYRIKPLEVYPGTNLLHRFADKLVVDPYFKTRGEDMWLPDISF